MRAAYVSHLVPDAPLDGLVIGERPAPEPREGWATVQVKAAALNHHDLWALRGVGLSDKQCPMILGTDAAGIAPDGSEVIVHGVIGGDGVGVAPGEGRSLLSEKYQGTLAEYVSVPKANLIPKPAALTFEEAACLPTAYLTAYNMLFRAARLGPGHSVLVQGIGGGVATAAIVLGKAAGLEVYATSRHASKLERGKALGAVWTGKTGERLPKRVDAVIESVGAATWGSSVRAVRAGGTIAVCGATSGDAPPAELTRIFFNEVHVVGCTMGTRADLAALANFLATTGTRPVIDSVLPLEKVPDGLERLAAGYQTGKIVISISK
ncbi:MAG: zinc-binding dehydrogenase [Cellulomonadaceae bacterium]|jgi:NADPH:quinone reductase-like Zn-dependent oxidoreductase|nr:zinc-binding dehydrogenase [Cellulomonadaceae bacterium]